MVLTDRQRKDLHASIYEYLKSRPGEAFQRAAMAFLEADPEAGDLLLLNGQENSHGNSSSSLNNSISSSLNNNNNSSSGNNTTSKPSTAMLTTPLLEKKWTAIPRLQKKVLELERQATQSAKIHAHRGGGIHAAATDGPRRLLPRLPCQHTLKGHSMGVTAVALHPIYTVVVSGSEDGTIKVGLSLSLSTPVRHRKERSEWALSNRSSHRWMYCERVAVIFVK